MVVAFVEFFDLDDLRFHEGFFFDDVGFYLVEEVLFCFVLADFCDFEECVACYFWVLDFDLVPLALIND